MRNTNFQNLNALLKAYNPEQRGFVTEKEIELIEAALQLDQMSVLDLRNLRDFTVLFLSKDTEDTDEVVKNMDRMSAIVFVIDCWIVKRGGDV